MDDERTDAGYTIIYGKIINQFRLPTVIPKIS